MQARVRGGVEGHAHRGTMSPKWQGRSVSSGGAHQAPARDNGRGPSEPVSSPALSPYKSKMEKAWAQYLYLRAMAGEIRNYWYEPLNLRLPGDKNFYKPDFLVRDKDDGLTFYEVKGHNQSDDRSLVKIKTAAGITPWARFVLVKRIGGQWDERVIA